MPSEAPTIDEFQELRDRLGAAIVRTPTVVCAGLEEVIGSNTEIFGKLEFLQHTGTFKARGALANVSGMSAEELERGITAVSAGNHAIAAAFAAQRMGTSAKVVMIETANPYRIEAAKRFGAEIVMAGDAHAAFERVDEIREKEGRVFVHPFEGKAVATGTGTVGLEICEQCEDLDAVVVSVGGGGLIAGIASAVKQLRPDVEVIGVETTGADSMTRSLEAGEPVTLDKVDTIADSLGAPFAMPYSFGLCREFVDRMVVVSETELRRAMGMLFRRMKVAVEPACAAPAAALFGPLRESLEGRRVALVFCGSNIDWQTWYGYAQFD
ncbi:MAG: pyridoxal-phosphate dependent enzyme [Woeseiaceae bacterium]|nr:pyridoxal-phosphate dependent enzyme [Woeseiaceae bacterium]